MKISLTTLPIFVLAAILPVSAQQAASDADKAFATKASQSNLYALAAAKAALSQADATDIKDIAWIENRDHEKLGQQLKSLASASGLHLDTALNPDLQKRLERLKSSSGRDFDNAYVKDMAALEEDLEKLLTEEATSSAAPYKDFAAKASQTTQHHINTFSQYK